jgi:ribonuclease HII
MNYIIGADEAGTGACAGSFVVCAVKAPLDWNMLGLADSKKLSPKKRAVIAKRILEEFNAKVIKYSLLEVSAQQIDRDGLGVALKWAHKTVINNLVTDDSVAIVDGKLEIEAKCPIKSMIKADSEIPTVMAASILAKTYRDNVMVKLHQKYPVYGWDKNFGYVVNQHKEAIRLHGLSEFHRKSYKLKNI